MAQGVDDEAMIKDITGPKSCTRCHVEKAREEFSRASDKGDGRASHCKACRKIEHVRYYSVNKHKVTAYTSWYSANNRELCNARLARWRTKNPALSLLQSARARARHYGISFNLTIDDITLPKLCPVLGLELNYEYGTKARFSPNSPSIDRIVPSLGYTKGNVEVISWRANAIKTNATPEELKMVGDYYSPLIKKKLESC
jgi:hypothetical protein